jgi:peptidylprolyl isomerase
MTRIRPFAVTLAVLSLAGAVAAGCGGSNDDGFRRDGSKIDGDPSTTLPAALAATTTPPAATTPAAGSRAPGAPLPAQSNVTGVSTDLKAKPAVPKATGAGPTKLSGTDVVTGTGPAVKDGDKVTVQYVGVLFKTGKQFDASWDRKQPFSFTVGQGSVIPGWDQGLIGMKAGGRRVLVIPSELAYKAAGSGAAIPPNSPLVFVIDLTKIG